MRGRWPAAKAAGRMGTSDLRSSAERTWPAAKRPLLPRCAGKVARRAAAGRMGTLGLRPSAWGPGVPFLAEDQIAKRVGHVVVVVPARGTVGRRLDQGQDLVQVVVSDLFLGPRDLLEPLPGGVVGDVTRLQPQLGEPVAERAAARP